MNAKIAFKNKSVKSKFSEGIKPLIIAALVAILLIASIFFLINYDNLREEKTYKLIKERGTETNATDIITEDEFDSLVCECLEWKGKIVCNEGFEMINNTCVDEIGKRKTNPSTLCSKYNCTEGQIVLVEYN